MYDSSPGRRHPERWADAGRRQEASDWEGEGEGAAGAEAGAEERHTGKGKGIFPRTELK